MTTTHRIGRSFSGSFAKIKNSRWSGDDRNYFDGVTQLFQFCLLLLRGKIPFRLLQGIVRHHLPRTRQCKQCSKRGLDAVGSREQGDGIKKDLVHRLGACPTLPSSRGEGGATRCKAAGPEKPDAYSLEYVEDFFGPRTTQMVVDRLPQ